MHIVPLPVRRRRLSRRGFLGVAVRSGALAAAAGTAAGCGLVRHGPAYPPAAPDPLEQLVAAKRDVIGRYVATLARHPDLGGRLGPLRDAHQAHLRALLAVIDPRRRATPESVGGATPSSRSVPAGEQEAMAALRAAETAAAARSRAACLAAEGTRAALLGSVHACERSHLVVLA